MGQFPQTVLEQSVREEPGWTGLSQTVFPLSYFPGSSFGVLATFWEVLSGAQRAGLHLLTQNLCTFGKCQETKSRRRRVCRFHWRGQAALRLCATVSSLLALLVLLWRPRVQLSVLAPLPSSLGSVVSAHSKCFSTLNHLAGPKHTFWWGGLGWWRGMRGVLFEAVAWHLCWP